MEKWEPGKCCLCNYDKASRTEEGLGNCARLPRARFLGQSVTAYMIHVPPVLGVVSLSRGYVVKKRANVLANRDMVKYHDSGGEASPIGMKL